MMEEGLYLANFCKEITAFVSTEASRYSLTGVCIDGDMLIASDGRCLTALKIDTSELGARGKALLKEKPFQITTEDLKAVMDFIPRTKRLGSSQPCRAILTAVKFDDAKDKLHGVAEFVFEGSARKIAVPINREFNFPDWKAVLPHPEKAVAQMDVDGHRLGVLVGRVTKMLDAGDKRRMPRRLTVRLYAGSDGHADRIELSGLTDVNAGGTPVRAILMGLASVNDETRPRAKPAPAVKEATPVKATN